ncbi:MAG: hypothetical protein H0V64_08220 [Geodermatophilaceae bacterium]|nr:hypothetical protein [Geodermatophilaceae bacterium]
MKASSSYKFSVRFGAGVGLLGLIFCIAVGETKVGIFVCIGLALGWLNTAMVVSATAKFASENVGMENPNKKKFMAAVVKRLALISIIAFYLMYAFRPEGLAVLFGLAFFQFTIIGSSAGVLYREVRSG